MEREREVCLVLCFVLVAGSCCDCLSSVFG
jgi:hypothetical protein